MLFVVCGLYFILFIINFFENSLRNTIKVAKSLDTDQARQNVGPGLGPYCMQRLSADDIVDKVLRFSRFMNISIVQILLGVLLILVLINHI